MYKSLKSNVEPEEGHIREAVSAVVLLTPEMKSMLITNELLVLRLHNNHDVPRTLRV